MKLNSGYTLIELLVASASASVLMVGLSSALFVSGRAMDLDEGAAVVRNEADLAVSRMMDDLKEARRFFEVEPTSLEFTVPDRNSDGFDETLRYSWSGVAGDPLLRQIDGGNAVALVSDVRSLDFSTLTRSVTALDVFVTPLPAWPIVESSSSVQVDPEANALTLPAPAGIEEGNLLLASVVIHNIDVASIIPPSGWTALDLNEDANHVSYSVWWKLAGASEPTDYLWRWTGEDLAIGVGLRISNQYVGNPLTSFVGADGKSESAECPATVTTLDNSLVVRFGGFHKETVDTVGVTGLPGHTDVFMDETKEVSSGVGYRVQKPAGDTGTASFLLSESKEFRTLTVVVAPKQ